MCIYIFAYKFHPTYNLILACNRDEVYARPTAALDYWRDYPQVLGGRDLVQMGTWLGITRKGRLAAVTNYREGSPKPGNHPSRGHIVGNYLTGDTAPREYLNSLSSKASQYPGFNLLIGDMKNMIYFSNRNRGMQILVPGIYGLSNHLLNTPWPKVTSGISSFKRIIEDREDILPEAFFTILTNQQAARDEALPRTGVDLNWERILSPIFITSPTYGTRCSSVVLIDKNGKVTFFEKTWQTAQKVPTLLDEKRFYFNIR
jgi:uncharacterized protein with NRDE domain